MMITPVAVVVSEQQSHNSSDQVVVDVASQHEEERMKCIHEPKSSTTASKIAIYVPPRLDQEYYQAEVLDAVTIVAPSLENVRGLQILEFM